MLGHCWPPIIRVAACTHGPWAIDGLDRIAAAAAAWFSLCVGGPPAGAAARDLFFELLASGPKHETVLTNITEWILFRYS